MATINKKRPNTHSKNKKRPNDHSVGRVYDDCAKDPMDPTGGLGRHSDIIGSMSKAADETAEVR